MKHYDVKNALVHVALERKFHDSLNRPLQGILILRKTDLTFTQTAATRRVYRHNPHVFDGRHLTVTLSKDGRVRFNVKGDLASLVKSRAEVESEIKQALDTLGQL